MLVDNLPFEEKLSLAINSADTDILSNLLSEPSSKVRRALARNLNTPSCVLNVLAYDPVLNVSYKALENPSCSVSRTMNDTNHPCVVCEVSEDKKSCDSCKTGMYC